MKRSIIILSLLIATPLATPSQAGYYGRQFNWNPWHPWHSWHAPRPYYQNNYNLGWRRGAGFGHCYYTPRCGW